jgi:probable HAF family extracellular repeat protein
MTNRNVILGLCAIFLTIAPSTLGQEPPAGRVSGFKDVNAPGAAETDPYAVNNLGAIAGDYVDSKSVQHGMILKGKALTTIDRTNCSTTPGATAIAFYGINRAGTVVGWCQDTVTGVNDAFSYFKGKFTTIFPPGSISTQAHGINDKGQIVGTYLDSANNQHGFLLSGKTYTTLDVPGGFTNSDAWAINNQGLITIFALNGSGKYDSFLFNGKSYKKIDVPKADQSFVAAIDSFGDRIYTILDASNNTHGAFFLNIKGGGYTVFDDPKGVGTTAAFGLNDKLRIVGRYAPTAGPSGPPAQGYSALGCCRGFPTK